MRTLSARSMWFSLWVTTITVRPGEPFVIEGLAVGLIRNSMLV